MEFRWVKPLTWLTKRCPLSGQTGQPRSKTRRRVVRPAPRVPKQRAHRIFNQLLLTPSFKIGSPSTVTPNTP